MKLVSGEMLWTKDTEVPSKYEYLSEDINCDVVIIGGGITGAICAYYFAKEGINTVLVDKNLIGYGSTSASTSILQYEIDTDLTGLSMMIGEENAVKSFKLCHKAVYDIKEIVESINGEAEFTDKDCLYYTEKQEEIKKLRKEYELRKKHGFDVEFIDSIKGKEMFDFPIAAGIYSRKGAGEINPYKFTHDLIRNYVGKNLRVYENTEIVDIENHADNVVLKTNNNFDIRAKRTIITKGFEAVNYFNKEIVNFYRTFTVATTSLENTSGWHGKCIIRDTNDPYYYIRGTVENRMIMGGEDIKIEKRNSKVANMKNSNPKAIEKYNLLKDRIKYLFPNIKDYEIEYRFSGLFGVTDDGLPYIGEYENMPNCYFCLGYGANGILYSTLGGQMLRDLYLGDKPKELELFRFDRDTAMVE